jgi:hypothetical protein
MVNIGTNTGELFAKNALQVYFETSIADNITNQDYEGIIKGGGADKLNILTFGALTIQDYTPGTSLTLETPTESQGQLIVNQRKGFYFELDDVSKWAMYAADPDSTLIQNAGKQIQERIDAYILGLHGDVAAGQRIGISYTTGTVEVAATTGVVTGTGTTFTSSMVGKGFKAVGHTEYYRVKTYTNATTITIENDLDDEASAYTGGAIAGGANYEIEANVSLVVTNNNIYGYILQLDRILNDAKILRTDRNLIVSPAIASVMKRATELIPAVATAYDDIVKKGLLGTIAGFTVYQSTQVVGDNTTGYWILAAHKSWCTKAMAYTKSETENVPGQFATAYKGLTVFGAKVVDERRKAAAALFCRI